MSDMKVTVPCPHCGSTSTYSVIRPGMRDAIGNRGVSCKNCHKSFMIYVRGDGAIERVQK